MGKTRLTPGIALLVTLLVSSGDYAMVLEQYLAQFDGIVVARTDYVHYPVWTRNLATKYVIRKLDGSEIVYHADPSMGHISGFPIGTRLNKSRWHLDYEADGRPANDFPSPLYAFFMTLDFGLLAACGVIVIMMRNRDRRERELEAAVERGRRLLERER